ncbi:hypothetical protein ONS95_011786 [Cadophora gregata]|uniref:uncharacterized protein n=1 Tax=Cadophora gregata TaxID=51156 RepID=UPI0026DB9C0F|nr:uncharacterized protein ONS95_011786 [Cadophora gregata]KAK0099547.1 hypothetical protein ONS95_011786 [Cadophora gregata]
MIPSQQDTVASATADSSAISNTEQKKDAAPKKLTFHDIPFDVRVLMWKDSLKDKTRVVPARTSLSEGNEYLKIAPDKESVAELAATFFQTDMAGTNALSKTLQVAQQEVLDAQNILFVGDLFEIFKPIYELVVSRQTVWVPAGPNDTTEYGLLGSEENPLKPSWMLVSVEPELKVESVATTESLAFHAFAPRSLDCYDTTVHIESRS